LQECEKERRNRKGVEVRERRKEREKKRRNWKGVEVRERRKEREKELLQHTIQNKEVVSRATQKRK
jgi:hypothetical protein